MYSDALVRVGNYSIEKRKQTIYMGMVPLDRITQNIYIILFTDANRPDVYNPYKTTGKQFRNGASEQDVII